MFMSVDKPNDNIEGFQYINHAGDVEFVEIEDFYPNRVTINTIDEVLSVHFQDIPKLIKARESAYQYKMSLIRVIG
jgi:hypothetical protein